MADKKSASRARSSEECTDVSTVRYRDPAVVRELIEAERHRLMRADAVLHCVAIALDNDDSVMTDVPHYQSVVDVARELIKESINRLDSVNLPLTQVDVKSSKSTEVTPEGERASQCTAGVKERAFKYMH